MSVKPAAAEVPAAGPSVEESLTNFVKLKRAKANGGGDVWVNLCQVFSIHPSDGGAVLKHGKNGEALVVLQTPDEIIAMDRDQLAR